VNSTTNSRVYLDYAATTPIDPRVRAAMERVREDATYNPSSPHAEGRRSRALLDAARERIARVLNVPRRSIVFTGGGTESNNLALFGVARAAGSRRHLVTSVIEHHAVSRAVDTLEEAGFAVTRIPVDASGRVDPETFAAALRPDTAIASVMYANNDIGTVQSLAQLGERARAYGIPFHTDAVAAAGWLPIEIEGSSVDLLSLAAHKFYGPSGMGVLYVRDGTPIEPMLAGGSQELGRRAGTEDVAGAVGMAEALELAESGRLEAGQRVAALRDMLESAVRSSIAGARLNGTGGVRLPSIASITFAGADPAALLMLLDLHGFATSAGSACTSGSLEPSHVIAAIGGDVGGATIRFSLGRPTTEEEIERLVAVLPAIVADAQRAEAM
jgi:cysteine desulfurase